MTPKNPKQETQTTFWPQTAFNWVELTLKAVLVFASIGAVYQYFDIKQENRVKQTMEQLKSFNSAKVQAAQLKLSRTWEAYQKSFEVLNLQTVASEKDKARIHTKIVLPVIRQKKLQQDIGLLVDFFENLQVCVQQRICDKQVSRDFFEGYANYFYHLHLPWIETQRTVIPDYACQLQAFVLSECQKTTRPKLIP